ncbi:MAG TPA: Calx-beta domain-containing protein [Usitatibacter sp.]|nr:Calx-beta domain-containing protein [Usitatibacter sp.]
MKRMFGALAAAIGLFVVVDPSAFAQAPTLLTGALPGPQADVLPPTLQKKPGLLRQRSIVLNKTVLEKARAALQRSPGTPVELSVPAFEDAPLAITITSVTQTGHGSIEFLGTVKGDPLGSAAIVMSHGLVAGTIHTNGHAYEIIATGAGQYGIQDVDRSAIRDEEDDAPIPHPSASKAAAQQGVQAALMADDGSTIDLFVAYTTAAKQQANNCANVPASCNDSAPILAQIDLAVATTNQAYANSGVTQRVRLVGTNEEVGYTEVGGNLSTDLQRLSNVSGTTGQTVPPDGFLDDVQSARDATGADIVSLWVADTSSNIAGLAWLQDPIGSYFEAFAYNVVVWDTASSNLTQPHEMGHNMGLRHDSFVDLNTTTPFPYVHGYVDTTHRFRTVMAYNDRCASTAPNTSCSRITGFSSPLFNFDGAPTGVAANADSARALNATAVTVANFRTSVQVGGTLAFRNAIVQTNEAAGTALIPVARLGGASGAASVNWSTTAVNAVDGVDFTSSSGTLNWADGDGADKNIPVPVLQDSVADGEKIFTVALSGATGAVLPTTGNVATVKIADVQPDAFPAGCANPSGWTTPAGNVGWYAAQGAATEGSCSFRSHNVAPATSCNVPLAFDNAQTQFTGTFLSGNITFDARVSSYNNFGCLQFSTETGAKSMGSGLCADANENLTLQGLSPDTGTNDTGWKHFSIPIAAGTHTITLKYQIPCVTDGDNTAYVDNLSMPIDPATVPTLAFSQPAYTVIEGGPAVSVTVARTGPSTGAIGVTWTTANDTGVAGTDFGTHGSTAQKTGTLSWASGDSSVKTITVGAGTSNVPVIDDSINKSGQDFFINLSAPTGGAALGAQTSTTVAITDNDSTYNFDTPTVSVGEAGPNITVGITRTGSLATSSTVTYTTSNGTAIAGTDFGTSGSSTQPSGTITFGPGVSARTITIGPAMASAPFIPVINDTMIEPDKTFNVTLSSPTGGGHLGTATAVAVTINSDDKGVSMAGSSLSLAENAGASQIQVNRLGSSVGTLSVNYAFTPGTAMSGTNFSGSPGTLNWADGDASPKFIPVTIIDDSVVNTNRTFTVTLSGATGGALGTPSSTVVTIVDNDNTLQFSAATASANEGASATLTVTRLGGASGAASVNWAAANGTAIAGTKYGTLGNSTPPSGTINWGAGDSASKTISIPILQDGAVTGNQTFTVALSSPSGTGTSLGATTLVTVTAVDTTSGVSFAQPTYQVTEGGTMVTVAVHRIGVTTSAIGVTWTTADGTAAAGTRFGTAGNTTQKTGTLAWAAGDAADKTFTVGTSATIPVINDSIVQPTQAFTIGLSNPTGGAILGPQPTTTVSILDDDSVFAFDTPTISVHEAGPNVTLNVTRTGSTNTAATVMFATTAGTATATTDYTTTSGTISFGAGETTKAITIGSVAAPAPHIPVINDALIEPDETFTVTLSSPTGGGHLGTPVTSTVTIISDNMGIAMAAATRTVAENAGAIDVVVQRLGPPTGAVSVNYTITPGTAINGTHYIATPSGQLNWADTDGAAKTIHVVIVDDSVVNPNRTFTVTLSGASGAALGTPASTAVTIVDDDNNVQFSSATASVTEGSNAMLSVTRTGGTANPASVVWTVANGTAVQGTDFGTITVSSPPLTGTLNWNAGDGVAKSISIPTLQNTTPQGARVFTVTLSSPTGATMGTTPTSTVTINDNDLGFVLSAATYTIAENAGNLTVTVNRLNSASAAASVQWTTANGTAVAGTRFGTANNTGQKSGTLSWAAGDATPKTFTVPIINNALVDGDATFTVSLKSPSTGSFVGNPSSATVTILDDDIPPESELAFSQPKYLVMENAGNVTVTVNRNDIGGGFSRSATVNYATANGTAMSTSDYTARTGTLTWVGGDSSAKDIMVPITNDSIAENPETFQVQLSNVTPGTRIATPNTTVLIVDDDEVFPHLGAFPVDWTTPLTANAGWMVSNDPGAFEGVFSLRSESITDGQVAQTQLTGTFTTSPSANTVSFMVKISSEANFDFLRFYIDGVQAPGAQWSGTSVSGWTAYSTPITSGVHTLTWSYEKDGSASLGSDAAWIDAVKVPPYTP